MMVAIFIVKREGGSYGESILVGAGPGDPELITLKGLKAIKEADVILMTDL